MNRHYKITEGTYFFYEDNVILFGADEVAIYFSVEHDEDLWTLHKHGSPVGVEKRCETDRQKYKKAGLEDIAGSLYTITGKWNVEELNLLLENSTGYVKRFLENHHIDVNLFQPKAKGRIESTKIQLEKKEYGDAGARPEV